jgi:PAS domain S-box-containing protein
MLDFFTYLFDTTGFPPRWHCGLWTAGHGWLHILSDLGVWSAYVAIPCVLAFFVLRRRDIPFRFVFLLFCAFILACGTTHLMEAILFWWPAYRLAGLIKLFTAVVSWATIFALVKVAPEALAMRSPRELEREVAGRKQAEEALKRANAELERRVAERTTELTRLNASLHHEREWFRVTLASIGDAAIATDIEGRVTLLNHTAEQLTGWSQAEAVGQPLTVVFRIVNEFTRRPVENPVAEVLRRGAIVGLANHTILLARDGTERPIDDSAAPIRDEKGIIGVVLVFRDITDRHRAEETRSRLAAIVESSEDAIIGKSLDGTITTWNKGAEHLFGYSAAETLGQSISLLAPPDRGNELPSILERVRHGERIEHYETVRRRKDGTRIDVSLSVSPVRDGEGRVVGVAKIARDITQRRQMEEALKEANRRKDEFLALLGHELRNPLAPLKNAVQILELQGGDPAVVARVREMIARQVTQMTRLVDELLDASRIARGKIQLRHEHLDLGALVRATSEDYRAELMACGLSLAIEVPNTPLPVDGDPVRLAQVLGNLLHNSSKYTDPSGKVTVRLAQQGGETVLSVADTGMGIATAALPRLFEVFSQIDASVERNKGGLGLGLSVVKRLVELHGGRVRAASEGPGRGSLFTVWLPLSLGQESGARSQESGARRGLNGHRKVLIVEDGRDAAESLRLLLSLHGFEVSVAHTGPEGLAMARQILPDAIVCDLGLPGISGYEVARALRGDRTTASALLVCVSGYGQEQDRRQAREAGFDEFLVKPPDTDALVRFLSESPSRTSQGPI